MAESNQSKSNRSNASQIKSTTNSVSESFRPNARSATVSDEVLSDVESEAPWDQDQQDAARAQYDQITLAGLNRMALDGDNVVSTCGEDSDGGESSRSSQDEKVRRREERKAEVVSELQETATRLSRISMMQMASMYRKGRAVRGGTRVGGEVDQRVFGLEGTEVLTELENAGGLYERLMTGQNVMVQYVARTGIGKTTRFGGLIAKKCGMRVLLLEPDVLLAKAAATAQRENVKVRDSWTRTRQEHLTVMTYADFCAQFYVKNGKLMLQQFDVVVMDEAHVPKAEVYATKAILATYGHADMNLIVLSATMDGDDAQSINNASPPKQFNGSLVEAVEAGKFSTGSRCRDRTVFIVPTDEDAARCQRALTEAGHVAYMLDSASRTSDVNVVRSALGKQSIVKRFLVMVEKFGTGLNIPLSAMFTSGTRKVYEMDLDTRVVDAKVVPVTSSELKQHFGRLNRGLAPGGMIAYFTDSGDILPDTDLLPTERLRAYLILRAAGIRPLSNIAPPRGFLPFGITPMVAADILAVNMPPEVTIRFYNADGRVSANFARGLQPFSQLQHYFITSPLSGPIGQHDWVKVPMGGYYGSDCCDDVRLSVPFDVKDDELRVKIHAICMIAEGKMSVTDWIPQLSDSEASGDETRVAVASRGQRPRLVIEEDRPPPVPPKADAWGFAARIEGQIGFAGDRKALMGSDTYTQAVLRALSETTDVVHEMPTVPVVESTDDRGVSRVGIVADGSVLDDASPIDVATPGGSVVVTLKKTVWSDLISGEVLSPSQFSSLMHVIRDNVAGFVRSNAFANWSNVWLAILRTCGSQECLLYVQRRGKATTLTAMLSAMYVRYSQGVASVTESSYVKAKFWSRVLKGRSIDQQLQRDRSRGKAEVMQSERFFRRVAQIRELTACALMAMEEEGIYMPSTVSRVQTSLPVSTRTGVIDIDRVQDTERSVVHKRREQIRRPSSGTWARAFGLNK